MLAHSSGLIFTSNWAETGGISVISLDGSTTSLLGTSTQKPIKPNGIALENDGSFLLAHLGDTDGGIYRLSPDGAISTVVSHANGFALPPTNFVTLDAAGRIWITVSTTKQPRATDYRADACTGFIAVAEPGQSDARIVANGLGYTNECVIDMDNAALYVNETFTRQLSRFDLADDGSLNNRHVVTEFSSGTFPDGVALDEAGDLWVTSIVSNRIIKVKPSGEQILVLEDADTGFVAAAEQAYLANTMSRKHLAATGNTTLGNTSSLAFGGNDLSIAYIGNLLGSCLHQFKSNTRGKPPVHWNAPLGHLSRFLKHG